MWFIQRIISSFQNCQNLCSKCAPRTQERLDDDAASPLADSGINDRLVKLRPLIDQTCFEFIDVSYFGAVNIKKNSKEYFSNI